MYIYIYIHAHVYAYMHVYVYTSMCVYLYRLVRSANLGANFLTAAAVRALRLDASPALTTLDLAGNDLGEEGAAALARVLADEGCGVECLSVANTGLLRAGTRFALGGSWQAL